MNFEWCTRYPQLENEWNLTNHLISSNLKKRKFSEALINLAFMQNFGDKLWT